MADQPSLKVYRQIPVLAFSDWTAVPVVKAGLNAHEFGLFKDSSLMTEAMGRDDRIEGVRTTRINALNGLPQEWEPADESQKALDVAADCEKLFGKMIPEAEGNTFRGWGLDIGLGLSELLWEDYGTSMWVPTIRIWNPQWIYWRWDTWTYWLNTADEQIEVFSGAKSQYKWFMYAPYGIERGWMKGNVRSLAMPWLIRQWGMRDWARYSEVHGSPIRGAVVPAEAQEPHKERFMREMAQLGNEMVVRLEQAADGKGPKFDLKLIEAQSQTWEGFKELLTMANTAIAVRMLGQNLTTEMGGTGASGSRAGATVHDRVRADFLRSDGSTFSAAFKEQVLEPFCLFNYGSRQLAPTLTYRTDPPDDKKVHADTLNTLGMGLNQLLLAGVPVDVIQFAKRYSIPLVGDAESTKPQADKDQGVTGSDDEQGKDSTDQTPKKGTLKQRVRALRQRSTRLKPHVEGQLFVDEVADHAVEAAVKVLRPDLTELLKIVNEATDYSDLRKRLITQYGKMDPSKFARLMDKALVLADHAGRHSVLEEL